MSDSGEHDYVSPDVALRAATDAVASFEAHGYPTRVGVLFESRHGGVPTITLTPKGEIIPEMVDRILERNGVTDICPEVDVQGSYRCGTHPCGAVMRCRVGGSK